MKGPALLEKVVSLPRAIRTSLGRVGVVWWRCPGLNGGPAAYESAALPTELHRHGVEFADKSARMIAEDRGRCLPNAC